MKNIWIALLLSGVAWPQAFSPVLIGYDPVTTKLVTIALDSQSMVIDRSSPANPVLKCALPITVGSGLMLDHRTNPPTLSAVLTQLSPPSITYRTTFTLQPSGTWTAPAFFAALPPNITDLVQVHRNGLLQGAPDITGLAYTAPAAGAPQGTPGTLELLPTGQWGAGDTVTALWVFPLQSINTTPTQ